MPDDKAVALLKRYDKVKSSRHVWEAQWQELRDLVRPNTSDFNRKVTKGNRRTLAIYDSTAPKAANRLASGLHSFCTSPVDRWFRLDVLQPDATLDDDAYLWLESVSDQLYKIFSRDVSNFSNAIHELYLDMGVFGTGVMYSEVDAGLGCSVFKSVPLSDVCLLEDFRGRVDTLYRDVLLTPRQCVQKFGKQVPKDLGDLYEKEPDQDLNFVHCVYPRDDRNYAMADPRNMAFASEWIWLDKKLAISSSGYREFPYFVGRWSKIAGESYGRGPGMDMLPDIKMLNAEKRVLIRSMEKIVDPPLQVPDDGFLEPISTVPSALLRYTPGTEKIEPLKTGGDIRVGQDQLERLQADIKEGFYNDLFEAERKKERQSAYEVHDDRNEQLQEMSPMLGRMESELLGPILRRTFALEDRMMNIPPVPKSLQGHKLLPVYTSPAARAQRQAKGQGSKQLLNDIIPLAQYAPDVIDIFDSDEYAKWDADLYDVPRKILRNPAAIAAIRQKRQQQQDLAHAADVGLKGSQAVKNLADASSSVVPPETQ